MGEVYEKLNDETVAKLISSAKTIIPKERDFVQHLQHHNYNDSLYLPTLERQVQYYKQCDRTASQRELHYRARLRQRKTNDNKTSHKIIKQAMETKPIKPLSALRRDKTGPTGEEVGSVACIPDEVDDIATMGQR